MNGKIVFNQALNVNNTIDTSNLSNGMYLFKITSDEGSLTTKVIKNQKKNNLKQFQKVYLIVNLFCFTKVIFQINLKTNYCLLTTIH